MTYSHQSKPQQRCALPRLLPIDYSVVSQVGAPLLVTLTHQINAGDDNEDRKRLKEKLKVCDTAAAKCLCTFLNWYQCPQGVSQLLFSKESLRQAIYAIS